MKIKVKFTKAMLFDKAMSFDSIEAFKAAQKGLYLWSLREKHFNELKYTFIARDMTSRQDWKATDELSFNEANKLDVLNIISSSFNLAEFDLDLEFAINESKTYKFKRDFRKFSKRVYDWAKKEKLLKEVEGHLK
ncbi:MAG TPA: hypothetical protein EYG89_01115 [Bacteroidia bacterium]|nr:hypothetical protein [Bacteroidia bacterium]